MTKSEYQNPKQLQMIQIQNPKQHVPVAASVSDIRILRFVFVSRFGFRTSNLSDHASFN
jgi:hypothetical protein